MRCEVNRDLENDFQEKVWANFSMGGLASFSFYGLTSPCAMSDHIPVGHLCVVLYSSMVALICMRIL